MTGSTESSTKSSSRTSIKPSSSTIRSMSTESSTKATAGSESSASTAKAATSAEAASGETVFAHFEDVALEFEAVVHGCEGGGNGKERSASSSFRYKRLVLSRPPRKLDSTSTSSTELDQLTDSVLSILRQLVNDSTGSSRRSVGVHLDVGADDGTGGAEEVLEVLPADVEGDLCGWACE